LPSTPTVKPPVCLSATPVDLAPHFSASRKGCVVLGKRNTGPAPQMIPIEVGTFGLFWTVVGTQAEVCNERIIGLKLRADPQIPGNISRIRSSNH
jgi:hypothetical protein